MTPSFAESRPASVPSPEALTPQRAGTLTGIERHATKAAGNGAFSITQHLLLIGERRLIEPHREKASTDDPAAWPVVE